MHAQEQPIVLKFPCPAPTDERLSYFEKTFRLDPLLVTVRGLTNRLEIGIELIETKDPEAA